MDGHPSLESPSIGGLEDLEPSKSFGSINDFSHPRVSPDRFLLCSDMNAMPGRRGFQEPEEQGYPSSSGEDLLNSVEKSFIKSADDFADSADSSQYIHQKEVSQDRLNAASDSTYKVFRAGQRGAWVSYEPNRPKKVVSAATSPWISRFRKSMLPAAPPEWNPLLHLKSMMKTLQDVPGSSKEEKIIADIIMKNCASAPEPSEPPAAEIQPDDEVEQRVDTKSSSSSHMNGVISQQEHQMNRNRADEDDEDDQNQVRLSPYLHDLLADEIVGAVSSLPYYRYWTTFPPWKDEQGIYA